MIPLILQPNQNSCMMPIQSTKRVCLWIGGKNISRNIKSIFILKYDHQVFLFILMKEISQFTCYVCIKKLNPIILIKRRLINESFKSSSKIKLLIVINSTSIIT